MKTFRFYTVLFLALVLFNSSIRFALGRSRRLPTRPPTPEERRYTEAMRRIQAQEERQRQLRQQLLALETAEQESQRAIAIRQADQAWYLTEEEALTGYLQQEPDALRWNPERCRTQRQPEHLSAEQVLGRIQWVQKCLTERGARQEESLRTRAMGAYFQSLLMAISGSNRSGAFGANYFPVFATLQVTRLGPNGPITDPTQLPTQGASVQIAMSTATGTFPFDATASCAPFLSAPLWPVGFCPSTPEPSPEPAAAPTNP